MRLGLPATRAGSLMVLLLLLGACGGDRATPADNQGVAATPAETVSAADGGGVAESGAMPPFAEVEGAHPDRPPVEAPIPAAFRGVWAETAALCPVLAHHNRLVISGSTLRFPTFVVTAASVDTPAPREMVVTGTAPGEGTNRPAEYHFHLDAAGDTLTDGGGGGMVRRRCS